jgi:hypothetical protein
MYIPDHMHHGIMMYVEHHIMPGSFLRAILANDIGRATGLADHVNINYLEAYIKFFAEYLDPDMWGSYEIVDAWIRNR